MASEIDGPPKLPADGHPQQAIPPDRGFIPAQQSEGSSFASLKDRNRRAEGGNRRYSGSEGRASDGQSQGGQRGFRHNQPRDQRRDEARPKEVTDQKGGRDSKREPQQRRDPQRQEQSRRDNSQKPKEPRDGRQSGDGQGNGNGPDNRGRNRQEGNRGDRPRQQNNRSGRNQNDRRGQRQEEGKQDLPSRNSFPELGRQNTQGFNASHGSKPPQHARNPSGPPTSGRADAVQVPATPPPLRSAWSKPLQDTVREKEALQLAGKTLLGNTAFPPRAQTDAPSTPTDLSVSQDKLENGQGRQGKPLIPWDQLESPDAPQFTRPVPQPAEPEASAAQAEIPPDASLPKAGVYLGHKPDRPLGQNGSKGSHHTPLLETPDVNSVPPAHLPAPPTALAEERSRAPGIQQDQKQPSSHAFSRPATQGISPILHGPPSHERPQSSAAEAQHTEQPGQPRSEPVPSLPSQESGPGLDQPPSQQARREQSGRLAEPRPQQEIRWPQQTPHLPADLQTRLIQTGVGVQRFDSLAQDSRSHEQLLNSAQAMSDHMHMFRGPVSAPMSAPSDARAHQFDARPAAGNQRSQAPMSHQELAAMSHLFNPAHAQGGYGLQQHINSGLPLQDLSRAYSDRPDKAQHPGNASQNSSSQGGQKKKKGKKKDKLPEDSRNGSWQSRMDNPQMPYQQATPIEGPHWHGHGQPPRPALRPPATYQPWQSGPHGNQHLPRHAMQWNQQAEHYNPQGYEQHQLSEQYGAYMDPTPQHLHMQHLQQQSLGRQGGHEAYQGDWQRASFDSAAFGNNNVESLPGNGPPIDYRQIDYSRHPDFPEVPGSTYLRGDQNFDRWTQGAEQKRGPAPSEPTGSGYVHIPEQYLEPVEAADEPVPDDKGGDAPVDFYTNANFMTTTAASSHRSSGASTPKLADEGAKAGLHARMHLERPCVPAQNPVANQQERPTMPEHPGPPRRHGPAAPSHLDQGRQDPSEASQIQNNESLFFPRSLQDQSSRTDDAGTAPPPRIPVKPAYQPCKPQPRQSVPPPPTQAAEDEGPEDDTISECIRDMGLPPPRGQDADKGGRTRSQMLPDNLDDPQPQTSPKPMDRDPPAQPPPKLQGPVRLSAGPSSAESSPVVPRSWAQVAQKPWLTAAGGLPGPKPIAPQPVPPGIEPHLHKVGSWGNLSATAEGQVPGDAGQPPLYTGPVVGEYDHGLSQELQLPRALPKPILNGHLSLAEPAEEADHLIPEPSNSFEFLLPKAGQVMEAEVRDAAGRSAEQEETGSWDGEEEAPAVEEVRADLDDQQKVELRDLLQHYAAIFTSKGVRLRPRGLINGGNICFMNSILQALMACQPFCVFLKHLQAIQPALLSQKEPGLYCLAALAGEFEVNDEPTQETEGKTFEMSLGGKPLSPEMMSTLLSRFNPRSVPMVKQGRGKMQRPMAKRDQEDAQEFLGYLLDHLHEELLSLKTTLKDSLQLRDTAVQPAESDGDGWVKQKKGNKKALTQETGVKSLGSFIHDLVGGQYVTQVRAPGAPNSETMQPFTLVNLDVVPKEVHSISDAIDKYCADSIIEDFRLEKGGTVNARMKMLFSVLPRLLILNLNRFTFDSTLQSSKVHKAVKFDSKLRIKAPWLAPESQQRKMNINYDLVSVVTHLGTTANSGHYIAHAIQQPSGKWLKFDDQNVSTVPLNKVLEEPAYLLFYQMAATKQAEK